jgi:single-stranded-DNA-specific exonuclease
MAAGGETPLHIAGTLGVDHWQGRAEVQLRVTDIALPPRF